MKKIKSIANSAGQSTIEFLLVSAFSIGFLFIFIQLAINLTGGFFVHYATFMASRTYLVFDVGDADAPRSYTGLVNTRTREVFDSYNVKPYGVYDQNDSFEIHSLVEGNINEYIYTGVSYTYTQPMSVFGFFGGGTSSTMVSESFLGKEPTRGECLERTRAALEGVGFGAPGQRNFVTVFDNGC